MTTYKTVGHAIADPNSHLARFMASARTTMERNDQVIAQWMAQGLTREQAYLKALASPSA